MLTDEELARLEERCRAVPLTSSEYVAEDFVSALLETVLDYQMQTPTVVRAMQHFKANRWDEIRTLEDLERGLARFPNTREGNERLARHLWGYRLWTRAEQLRGLVAYFRSLRVTDMKSLRVWARRSTFDDFKGKVRGLGPAVYHGLVMRLGVDTVKPDVHILRFVEEAVGRRVTEEEAIDALREVASRLGIRATVLDWSLWDHAQANR